MGSRDRIVIDFESRPVLARVTKYCVTFYSKTCNKNYYSRLFLTYKIVYKK